MSEETKNTMSDSEFFANFMSEQTDKHTMRIAKAQDTVNKMNSRIEKLVAEQEKNKDTIKACNAVLDSKAYPALSPVISAFKEIIENSSKNKEKKIEKAKKKIKKANRKIQKEKNKLTKVHTLKNFISAIKNSENSQTAFIDGMKTLKADSSERANNKLNNVSAKIDSLMTKLQDEKTNNADKLKIKAKVQKLQSKQDKIIARINNLNELDQSLNKLAKIELVKEKAEELANTTVETAEKSAMKAGSISEIIDDIVLAAPSNIKNILNEEKTQVKDDVSTTEKSEEKTKQTERQLVIEHPVKEQVTQQQMKRLVDSGMPMMAVKKDNKLFAVFEKADFQKVNDIIASTKKEVGQVVPLDKSPKR